MEIVAAWHDSAQSAICPLKVFVTICRAKARVAKRQALPLAKMLEQVELRLKLPHAHSLLFCSSRQVAVDADELHPDVGQLTLCGWADNWDSDSMML